MSGKKLRRWARGRCQQKLLPNQAATAVIYGAVHADAATSPQELQGTPLLLQCHAVELPCEGETRACTGPLLTTDVP